MYEHPAFFTRGLHVTLLLCKRRQYGGIHHQHTFQLESCSCAGFTGQHEGSARLYQDLPFIAANKDLMCEAGGLYHCLLVCAQNRRDGILVESEGYDYSRYTAYAADRSALNLRDVPVERHNRKLRQPRSGPDR